MKLFNQNSSVCLPKWTKRMLWWRLTLETGSHCFCMCGSVFLHVYVSACSSRPHASIHVCIYTVVCVVPVCVSASVCSVLQKAHRKGMMIVKQICYYRNQKFISCLFLAPQRSNETQKHAHRCYLDTLILIIKICKILSYWHFHAVSRFLSFNFRLALKQ